ncbi:glycosyltransferase family 4 protein [Reichenbachiella agarivorans]|uniref:Glycosyltransferase family 4 protein n=1 Tax=Reichenbachiella agarivorans TaxID=2979464 RepID=A0ABY6CK74_9BACT|nr:glycosyltransferase family 4 protein [Reichenbachiella agarivorans]UXP30911.1 glycosyltransferase family 4 protein [Reichenbachiella agarivorans]
MMRVILTCNFSPWSAYSGGGQRSTHSIATHLANAGVDVHVIYTKSPFENIHITEPVNYNIVWGVLPALKSKRTAILRNASIYSVKKQVDRLITKSTVVHSNGEESALLGYFKPTSNFRLVCTPRYPLYPEIKSPNTLTPPSWYDVLSLNKYQLLAHTISHADIIAPTSQFAAETIQQTYQIADSKIKVIPNGIIDDVFDGPKRRPVPGSIFFFGRLEKTKGVDILLEAFAQLSDYTTLTTAGSGLYFSEFKNRIEQLGLGKRVKHIDWLNHQDIAKLISESAIVCLPSLEESFGNSIAEAMAAGAPIVTTTAGSIPELITNEKNGYLTEPGNVQALAACLQNILDTPDRAEELAQAAKITAGDYRWNSIAEKWISLYSNIL